MELDSLNVVASYSHGYIKWNWTASINWPKLVLFAGWKAAEEWERERTVVEGVRQDKQLNTNSTETSSKPAAKVFYFLNLY